MKLIVLTPEPLDADALRAVAGDEAEDAEVLVISPATTESGLRFWMNDIDEAIQRAQQTAEETADRLSDEGIDAAGDSGEAEPALALQDALATFPADQIVVFTRPDEEEHYRETHGLDDLGVPIRFAEISG